MKQISTDPIADMLSRIRNATAVNKNEITLPHSNIKEAISRILQEANYINHVTIDKTQAFSELHLTLFSDEQGPRITEIRRLSKPGRRTYVKANDIPTVKRGRGIVIVSTSKGIMSGSEAKKQKIGGELICKVY